MTYLIIEGRRGGFF